MASDADKEAKKTFELIVGMRFSRRSTSICGRDIIDYTNIVKKVTDTHVIYKENSWANFGGGVGIEKTILISDFMKIIEGWTMRICNW